MEGMSSLEFSDVIRHLPVLPHVVDVAGTLNCYIFVTSSFFAHVACMVCVNVIDGIF